MVAATAVSSRRRVKPTVSRSPNQSTLPQGERLAPVSTAQTARASAKCRAIRLTSTSTEVDHHVLDLGVVRQCFDALLASESAALVAAKGQADAALDAVAVDAHLS